MTWAKDVEEWSSPPIDDVGYISSAKMLEWSDVDLIAIVARMRKTRYRGWRNHGGLWRSMMGLDLPNRDVLDFGCGVGVEALELALIGNRVTLADISPDNLRLATMVLRLHGAEPTDALLVQNLYPFVVVKPEAYDTFHCNGVLHHIRWPRQIMERAHQLLRPGGEARLMLYSDRGWRTVTGSEPPDDVTTDPDYRRFVRAFDAVGTHADWYDEAKLIKMFGDLFTVSRFSYLTPDDRYCAAVLTRRDAT